MRPDHIWIDEAFLYRQTEPTPAHTMARLQWWEQILSNRRFVSPTNTRSIGMEVESMEYERRRIERQRLKDRRRREMENCMHGRIPFRIRWAPGVHPSGDEVFYVKVDGLKGGPYLLNKMQHDILHQERHGHEHVRND